MISTLSKAAGILLGVFVPLVLSCAGAPTLTGFPSRKEYAALHGEKTLTHEKLLEELRGDISKIEASGAGLEGEINAALYRETLKIFLTLSNVSDGPEVIELFYPEHDRSPLLYPRVTFPAVLEAPPENDAGPWIVPVVLSTDWLEETIDFEYEDPADNEKIYRDLRRVIEGRIHFELVPDANPSGEGRALVPVILPFTQTDLSVEERRYAIPFSPALSAFAVGFVLKRAEDLEGGYRIRLTVERARQDLPKDFEQIYRIAVTEDQLESPVFLPPAKIVLSPPTKKDEEWYFVVAADVQHHSNLAALRAFLMEFNPALWPHWPKDGRDRPKAATREEKIRFVVLAGDIVDGAAGNAPVRMVASYFGLGLQEPAYFEEYPAVQKEILDFPVPVFAVPGNHDGFVGRTGVLVTLTALVMAYTVFPVGILATDFDPVEFWRETVGFLNHFPVGVILGTSLQTYDGLELWKLYLGPREWVFDHGGIRFLGLNTYNLTRIQRSAVGGLSANWGGGLDADDVLWLETMSAHSADKTLRSRLLFLHHDPRAATPDKASYKEICYGNYHYSTGVVPELTLGLFNYGVYGTFIPFVTPTLHYLGNAINEGKRFQQEWMRNGYQDRSCYGAEELIDFVNRNLPSKENPAGISHIFMGHNDVPIVSQWRDEKGDPLHGGSERAAGWKYFLFWLWTRIPTSSPPDRWDTTIRNAGLDNNNAAVIRLDDVGNVASYHGFHLVKVKEGKVRSVQWVPLAR